MANCCSGRVMAGPSGVRRRHTCRELFGQRYPEDPRQTAALARAHRAESARTGIGTLTHPAVSNTDLHHWTWCEVEPCVRCDLIEAHLDDEDDDGRPW